MANITIAGGGKIKKVSILPPRTREQHERLLALGVRPGVQPLSEGTLDQFQADNKIKSLVYNITPNKMTFAVHTALLAMFGSPEVTSK